MRQIDLTLCLLLAASSASHALAQDDQTWTSLSASGAVTKDSPVLASLDLHYRSFASSGDRDVSIIRPALGYRVSPSLDLWAGYAWVTLARDGEDVREERFWQQASYALGPAFGGKLTARTRVEQRFRDGQRGTGVRLRQQLRYAYRFDASPIEMIVSDELFLSLNDTDWGQSQGFDQNRLFLGLSFQASSSLKFEGGYVNQIIEGADDDTVRHNWQLSSAIAF